ncbi:MAG: hypothetical protein JJU02_15105 [Cryomorphaceae bacterium]|nr:hypothetical protein [Cryomorphaceae bacterium]
MNDPRTPDGRPLWLSGQFIFGLIIAVVLPPVTLILFSQIHGYEINDPGAYRELIKVLNVRLLSASVIVNVGVFFLGLKFDKELFSRGVLYGTVLVFVAILLYKYV